MTPYFLQDPSLYKLPLLPRITTVDDELSLCHETLDDRQLSLVVIKLNGLYPEAIGDHRKDTEAPSLPFWMIVVRLLEGTQVSEGPGHDIPIALDITDTTIDIPIGSS